MYDELVKEIMAGDLNKVASIVNKLLESGKKPAEIIERGLIPSMDIIGKKYECGEIYLVEVIVAANAFKKAMEILRPHFRVGEKKIGTVVMGTVEGDIHDLGKNLVCVALEVSGFNVVDLGNDVKASTFSSAAKSSSAVAVGMSSLITTTMMNMKETIDQLTEDGIRDEIKVICGGAPVDEQYVKEIGGDLYGPNAFEGVAILKKALGVS